jgi:transcriptional regulator with XRE-family HTH domain
MITIPQQHRSEQTPDLSISNTSLTALRTRYEELGTHQGLAAALGVHPSTVSRVLSGKAEPGTKFVAGVLRAGLNELLQIDDRPMTAPVGRR